MDGFTPTFFLNLIIALLSGGIAYGVLKTDLKNTIEGLAEERRLREIHEKEDDNTHHDIRDGVQGVNTRLAIVEGMLQRDKT